MADQEIKAANETYSGFLSMMKVGTITGVVVVGLLLILLS